MLTNAPGLWAQTVRLTAEWDANPEPDIAGYILFVGTRSGIYSSSVDVGNVTRWQGLFSPGARYYFAVKAYNTSLQFSQYSAEVYADVGGGSPCEAALALSYAGGTLTMGFTLKSTAPATWSVFLFALNTTVPLWAIRFQLCRPRSRLTCSYQDFRISGRSSS